MKTIPDSSQLKKRRNEKIYRKLRKGSVLFGVILITVLGSKALAEAVAIQSIDLEHSDMSLQEEIVVDTGFYNIDEPKVELINSDGETIEPKFKVVDKQQIVLTDTTELKPGEYRYKLYDGDTIVFSENFTWGVLAINTNKSIYKQGDQVKFAFGVLDPMGNMVCDAELKLTITSESGDKKILETPEDIKVNPECTQHDFTLVPDYEAKFDANELGTYTLTLDADTQEGKFTIYDSFKVEELPDFDVERISATRLYPINKYPMEIIVKANKHFKGQIVEILPAEFEIEENPKVRGFDEVSVVGVSKHITWNVDLEPGEIITVGYTFDAPDISPEVYRAGKLKFVREGKIIQEVVEEIEIVSETTQSSESTQSYAVPMQMIEQTTITEFEEQRFWLFANDAVGLQDATRIYTTGFELNSTTAEMEYTSNINSPAISSSTYRSGAYALNTAVSGSNSTEGIGVRFSSADSAAAWTSRAYLRIATLPNTTTDIIQYTDATSNLRLAIRMTTGGALQLYSYTAAAQVGSDSAALSTGTWYRIEMWGDGAAAGSAEMGLRIDGVNVAETSTGELGTSLAVLNIGILTSAQADFYWDDVAINTDSYSGQYNWPGEGKVVYLRPNGNGSNTAWTGDYTAVDESPTPNDATDYINCTAASQLEDYTYQDSNEVGIGENDTIRLMEAWTRTSSTTTSSRNHQLSLTDSGGTDTPSVTTVASTSWLTDDDGYPRNASIIAYDDIGATNYDALTPTDVDNIQTQLNSTDCTPNTRITAVWIVVEYVPAEGGRLFSSGFELQSTTAGMEWSGVSGTISTTTGVDRSGDSSLSIDSLGSGTEESVLYNFTASGTDYSSPIFFRSYLYITTAPGSANRVIEVKNNAGTTIAYMTLDNSRILRLYDEDGQVGSASAALGTSTWYRIEMKVDASGSGSTDTVEGKIDGSTFATSSTRNLSTGIRTYLIGGNLNAEANTTGLWYFDDCAINIARGTVQNGYPGFGRIVHLNPDANGSYGAAWTGAYGNIDETSPNDATDVIYSTTLDQVESQTLEDTATAGIPSNTNITLVSPGARFSINTDLSAVTLRVFDSTGTRIESPARRAAGTSDYYTNSFTEPYEYPLTMYTLPMKSASWTTTELDSAQLGQRLIVDAGGNFNISTVWLLVEYDDSIAFSGTCDAFDQTTDCGDTGTIRYAVNGTLQFASQETVAGTWSITGIPAPTTNDIITTFIDGASDTDEAVNVTKYDGASGITGITLFKEHLVVGSGENQSMTNTNLGQYDNSVSSDEDIFHDVSSGNLTVDSTAQSTTEELYIDASDTLTPGGTVTTHDIEIDGTFTAEANAVTVGGSWDNDSNFSSSGTVTFTATSGTEIIDSTGASTHSFNNLILGSGSGTATWNLDSALDINNDLTISYGTLGQSGTNNITLAGSLLIDSNGSYTKDTGTFTFDGTTAETITNNGTVDNLGAVTFNKTDAGAPATNNKVTLASSAKVDTATIDGTGGSADTLDLGSSSYTFELANAGATATVLTVTGTLTIGTSTIKYSATNSGGNININNLPYSSLEVSGSETYVLTGNQTSSNAITGNLTIGSGATLDVTTAPYSITLNGNWTNGGTFTARTGTVTIGGTGTSTISGTTTFSTFTSSAASKTIKFQKHTANVPYFTFSTFTLTGGGAGTEINLESDTASSQWLANFTGAQSGSTYVNVKDSGCYSGTNTINMAGGTNNNVSGNDTSCWLFSSNTAPNSPSSLAQKKTTDVSLATGDWTNETSVKFTVTASDTDNPDTLYLCIEYAELGIDFGNIEHSCGSGVAYSGTPVTLTHTIGSLTNSEEHHWQARVKDSAGAYSAWVSYGGNAETARDYGIDTSAPTGGTVFDKNETGVDHDFNDGSLSIIYANWSGFSDAASGILRYEYAIGTTPSGQEIVAYTTNGTSTSVEFDDTEANLRTSQLYYFTVRAVDNAGNVQTGVSSDGQAIAPTLSFAISPSSVTFANLNSANSYTDTETTTLTTSTNAYNGYVVRAFQNALLTSTIYPGTTIANYSGGSYASPDEFLSGDLGFGYTSSDTSVQGSNIFGATPCAGGGNPPCYAPFSLTGPGDIVADHTLTVAGEPISNEQFTITYKVRVDATQKASPYSTTIIYTVIPIF